jgi:hypothetical protein
MAHNTVCILDWLPRHSVPLLSRFRFLPYPQPQAISGVPEPTLAFSQTLEAPERKLELQKRGLIFGTAVAVVVLLVGFAWWWFSSGFSRQFNQSLNKCKPTAILEIGSRRFRASFLQEGFFSSPHAAFGRGITTTRARGSQMWSPRGVQTRPNCVLASIWRPNCLVSSLLFSLSPVCK